jgi:hypothetical protein
VGGLGRFVREQLGPLIYSDARRCTRLLDTLETVLTAVGGKGGGRPQAASAPLDRTYLILFGYRTVTCGFGMTTRTFVTTRPNFDGK